MDSQVLNWLCAIALFLMPGVFTFMIVTRTRGWLRAGILVVLCLIPPALGYNYYHCFNQSTEIDEPCFAEAGLAWVGFMLGLSALLGAASGVISNLFRHSHAPTASSHAS